MPGECFETLHGHFLPNPYRRYVAYTVETALFIAKNKQIKVIILLNPEMIIS
jgi:hypothetical protein